MRDERVEDIYALWEELADFPASQSDGALGHLLSRLCAIFDAQNALWSVVVRLPTPPEGDRLNGWRPCLARLCNPLPQLARTMQERVDKLWRPEVDISAVIGAAGNEPFLTRLLFEALPADWFEGDYYRRYYLGVGHADQLSVRYAINDDVRIHVFLYRGVANPRFTPEDKAPFTLAIRGLKWFQYQLLLSHGIHAASSPLTPTERNVLLALLGSGTEKEIAESLGKSRNTVHVHIKSIYDKFGVRNRPALTALWLGQGIAGPRSKASARGTTRE
ncbi:LuxR C-terminal-related transcriptional regulator [Tahibacter sp. UC22_41]|uniref:helix-turn-helix transcriptional regulator n=1 Tax=Tahibacter sp. UC22_41 TaxID=3350178 RepID=UPI0036D869CF